MILRLCLTTIGIQLVVDINTIFFQFETHVFFHIFTSLKIECVLQLMTADSHHRPEDCVMWLLFRTHASLFLEQA